MDRKVIKKQLLKEIKQLKSKDGFLYAGLPHYKGLFGRDSLISAWQLLGRDPKIAKDTLRILAKAQGEKTDTETEEEPGKILHEFYPKNTPDEWWNRYKAKFKWLKRGRGVYKSFDSTFLFLIVAGKYFEKTGDKKFISKIFSSIKKAIAWTMNYADIDGDGFFEYEKKTKYGQYHMGWKDRQSNHLKIEAPVAIVEIQGYAYSAFKEAAKLLKIFREEKLANELLKKAMQLRKKFNKKFWMADKKYFCLALDGKKEQRRAITSNPGHLLFTGIIEKDKIPPTIKRLFAPDMWTPYGIRNHSALENDFDPLTYHFGSVWPHDNWIIAQGLKKLGYKNEYCKIKNAIFAAYKEIGFIPEFYGVVDNGIIMDTKDTIKYPQAWATGALLNFLENK